MVSSFRYPLYSLFLLSFDLKSVTIFYHVKKLQCSSQNRACGFPAHGSSVKFTPQATVHTDYVLYMALAKDIASSIQRISAK